MTKVTRAPGAPTAGATSAPAPDWVHDYVSTDKASPDQLDNIRQQMVMLRDLLMEKGELKERLTKVNKEIEDFQRQKLPELFMKAGVNMLGLEPQGNHPAYNFKLEDYFYANIAADWEPALRKAGFATVRELGGEDTIKNTFTLRVGRGADKLAQRILKGLRRVIAENPKAEITIETKEEIQWNTLTAWFQELVETGREPTSEQKTAIGGQVGKIIKAKEIKPGT
jgi:hypothetical protein